MSIVLTLTDTSGFSATHSIEACACCNLPEEAFSQNVNSSTVNNGCSTANTALSYVVTCRTSPAPLSLFGVNLFTITPTHISDPGDACALCEFTPMGSEALQPLHLVQYNTTVLLTGGKPIGGVVILADPASTATSFTGHAMMVDYKNRRFMVAKWTGTTLATLSGTIINTAAFDTFVDGAQFDGATPISINLRLRASIPLVGVDAGKVILSARVQTASSNVEISHTELPLAGATLRFGMGLATVGSNDGCMTATNPTGEIANIVDDCPF